MQGGTRGRRGPLSVVIIVVIVMTLVGLRDSPYDRVGPGPALPVGSPADGSWSVMTVRVWDANWFQWAMAEVRGERTVKRSGRGGGGTGGGGTEARPTGVTMAGAQTRAVVVAAQLAAGREPVGALGLQVVSGDGPAADPGANEKGALRPGDVVLAAGEDGADGEAADGEAAGGDGGGGDDGLVPLRSQADLETAIADHRSLRALVVPRTSDDQWGSAEIRTMPAARLARTPMRLAVSATAHPLGHVEGPSAGLVLALARLDALTPGDLTGGRRVAGTGALSSTGDVDGVGDVAEKVLAAADAGLDVFFVPVWQRNEAVAAAEGTGVTVVPVRTVREAVGWLCLNGGRAPTC